MSCLISELNEFCCIAIAAQPQDTQAASLPRQPGAPAKENPGNAIHVTCHSQKKKKKKKKIRKPCTKKHHPTQPPPTACMNFLEQSETPSEHENNGKNTNCRSLMKQQLRGPKVATCHCTVASSLAPRVRGAHPPSSHPQTTPDACCHPGCHYRHAVPQRFFPLENGTMVPPGLKIRNGGVQGVPDCHPAAHRHFRLGSGRCRCRLWQNLHRINRPRHPA